MATGPGGIIQRERSDARRARALLVLLAALLATGCASEPRPAGEGRGSPPLAVQVYADTGRGGRLSVRPPAARVWLVRVTPARADLRQVPAPPAAEPEILIPPADASPAPEVDGGLQAPVLRAPVRLDLPGGRRAADWVDLDVRVDEAGAVSEALWVAGSDDTALVAAARRCALSMRFYPALRAGREVPVWCRQRFDFRSARPAPGAPSGR